MSTIIVDVLQEAELKLVLEFLNKRKVNLRDLADGARKSWQLASDELDAVVNLILKVEDKLEFVEKYKNLEPDQLENNWNTYGVTKNVGA